MCPATVEQFQQIFGEDVSVVTLGKAIASYERTLLSGNSPFDRWYFGGDTAAVSHEVKAGFKLFMGRGQCFTYRSIEWTGTLLTGQGFLNTGVAQLKLIPDQRVDVDLGGGLRIQIPRTQLDEILLPPSEDLGRYEITLDPTDLWRYKTPSLRNIALTAPYMHNGGYCSRFEEVIDYYDRGGTGAEGQDPRVSPLQSEIGKINAPCSRCCVALPAIICRTVAKLSPGEVQGRRPSAVIARI